MSKLLTFLKGTETKPFEDIKATAMEMERNTLKAVINLVDVSKLVDLTELLEHLVIEDYSTAMAHTGRHRRVNSSRNSLCNIYNFKNPTSLLSTLE